MPVREEKVQAVQSIKEKLERCQSAILTDYRGLNVAQVTELRRRLREEGVEYRVLKNTLTLRAANELGLSGLEEYLEGPTAIAFGYDDPVIAAKILAKFAKENNALEVKAGVLEGNVIDAQAVKDLADLPSREELLGKVLGAMLGPLYGLANVLQGPIRGFAVAVDGIRRQKEETA